MLRLTIALPLVTVAVAASAQNGPAAAYARQAGDTLRFREITHASSTLLAPRGTVVVSSEHDATMAVTFFRGDTARAWYETLVLSARSPAGDASPATEEALRKPFVLRFDARGRVETISTPRFPRSFEGVTDLSRQFEDFFLTLPDQPLAPGTAWVDTAVRRDSTAGRLSGTSRVSHYRVLRDTVVGREPAVVIGARQELQVESVEPGPQPGLTTRSLLAGADSGVYVFAPATGRLLGRVRKGKLEGTLAFEGGAQPVRIPQRFEYENTLTAVEGKR
jgi:hypothetical protein